MSPAQPDGYLATPTNGTGSPVLVLHAWWGLNDTIKAYCDRLAQAGFVVFAPDLYDGVVTDQISEAERLVGEMDARVDQTRSTLKTALQFLKDKSGMADAGVAVIGFSMGAFYAVDLSASHPGGVRRVVLFYGAGAPDFSKAKAAYLGHFAENDDYEDQEFIDALEADLKAAGRPVTFHTYAGTGHWFAEPDRTDVYDDAAATLAWERTLAFLKEPG